MKRGLCLLLSLMMLLCCFSFSTASADDVETIQVAYLLAMNQAEERDLVQTELNRLLDEKGAGYHVELVCIGFSDWSTQISNSFADGSIDLFNCCFMPSISVLADNGSIAPLDDLLAEYGQGITETLGDYIECARIGGKIYGTPKMDAFSTTQLFFMSKAIADEVGIDPESITDYASLTEALKTVKAAKPDLTMIANGSGGGYFNVVGLDALGGSNVDASLDIAASELKVVNGYETEIFKEMLSYAKEWSELGFFMNDPMNAQDGAFSYVSNGQAFGTFGQYCSEEVGKGVQEKGNGMELYVAQVAPDAYATTSNVTSMTWCITSKSEHKEAAMKFLNALYTDADIANLMCNGIEGKHYVKTDAGNIDFAEGLDSFTTGWPSGMGTFWPNITITLPWTPDKADVYADWLATNSTCTKSPAMGFVFDSSEVSDEVTACDAVVDKYVNALLLGLGDTDALYEEFISQLDAAGLEDVIAEKQAQLNDWSAAQ